MQVEKPGLFFSLFLCLRYSHVSQFSFEDDTAGRTWVSHTGTRATPHQQGHFPNEDDDYRALAPSGG